MRLIRSDRIKHGVSLELVFDGQNDNVSPFSVTIPPRLSYASHFSAGAGKRAVSQNLGNQIPTGSGIRIPQFCFLP